MLNVGHNSFKIVHSSDSNISDFESVFNLLEWRYYQSLPIIDTLTLKFGHINSLIDFNFTMLLRFITDSLIFLPSKVRFSLFVEVDKLSLDSISKFSSFTTSVQSFVPGWESTVAIVYQGTKNPIFKTFDIDIPSNISCNFYYLNDTSLQSIELTDSFLINFRGFDIPGAINHFNVSISNECNYKLLGYLYENNRSLLEKISPEYIQSGNPSKSLEDDIEGLVYSGFLIKDDFISPIVYGSFDDFVVNKGIKVGEFLLNSYSENLLVFRKIISKMFIKSKCFACKNLPSCLEKMFFWSNIQSDKCSFNFLGYTSDG